MKVVLIDTSCIVALLDKSEHAHKKCVNLISKITAPLITCEAVIAESCYLLRNMKGAADAVVANVEEGNFQIPFDLSISAGQVRELIKRYKNLPMDFADACLVCLAEEFESGRILTLDQDFSVYRWKGNKAFETLLL